jgi:hypothetical protein
MPNSPMFAMLQSYEMNLDNSLLDQQCSYRRLSNNNNLAISYRSLGTLVDFHIIKVLYESS